MVYGADRRQLLAGLAALPLMACTRADQDRANDDAPGRIRPPALETIDFSALEARAGGRLGFAIHDIDGEHLLSWRGEERFVYCSTFKMYLAAATMLRIQAGAEQLDRQVPITRADMLDHAPVTETAIGRSLTVERLMQAIVEVSDNPGANLLLKALGGIEAMRGFYRSIGDQSTTVDRFEPEMNRLDGDKDTITPAQSLANLTRLFVADSPLTPANQTRLLGWMFASPTGDARIKAGVPTGWRVAHKTGTGGYGPVNDIGLLYPPASADKAARPLIITAYYHGTRASRPDAREAVIAEATRTALRALGHD